MSPRVDIPAIKDRLRKAWSDFRFRRHWPWVLIALGLLLWISGSRGCAWFLAWIGGLVLVGRGLRWIWDRLLFKVSRRLWVILLLMSVLPVLGLGLALLSFAWLGLGAQVSRSTQQTLTAWEEALKAANAAPTDAAALQMLQTYGGARVERSATLPPGVPVTFVGMVWADSTDAGLNKLRKDTYLRAVRKEPGGFRLLSLDLGMLGDRAQAMAGGQVAFRLALRRDLDQTDASVQIKAGGETKGEVPILAEQGETLATWTKGQRLEGSVLNKPFNLPPLAFTLVDWPTGRSLVMTATPETNLFALFEGYKSTERQAMSWGAMKAVAVIALVLFALIFAQFVATLLGLRLAWSLGRAVNGLHKGVQRLSLGDFSVRIPLRGRDQVAHLTSAFNAMAGRLQTADQERGERLRMEEELRVAREVQMHLLPDLDKLHLPSVRAIILPALEVAGDYYDVFPLADGSLAFLIADVSGKGTSAAFYAAETKGVLSALDKQVLDPVEVVNRMNAIWCQGHSRHLFLTLVYGTYHPRTGRYCFVRAGHPAAFLRRADTTVTKLTPRGIGIGMSSSRFREMLEPCEGTLEPGDSLVFYTDGLSEAQDPAGAFYGEDRIELVLKTPGEDPQNVLLADVKAFLQGGCLADDLTLLILSR
jgi:serine phosphatase RsbU (regulator of sigma subunit)